MAIKVNDHVIPDWAIEGQAQSLFQSLAEKMAGKPREVIQMAAIDLAKDRLIDQTLMSRESQKRDYKVDAVEVSKQMKQWIRQNGGKKAFEKGNHPVIKDKESLRKEITNQIRFNMLLEEESKCEPVSEEEARKYYDSRPELFKTEETVTASHLLKKASTEEEFAQAKIVILEIRDNIEKGDETQCRKQLKHGTKTAHRNKIKISPKMKVTLAPRIGPRGLRRPAGRQVGPKGVPKVA